MGNQSKSERAVIAADDVLDRHLRRLWALPTTRIAAVAWPVGSGSKTLLHSHFGTWNYWWHAHLVDLVVDAAVHRGSGDHRYDADLANLVNRLLRGIRLHNLGRWTNNYYDDMAWMGLAIERADRLLELRHGRALRLLVDRMLGAWVPGDGGGIPWRTSDQFFNAPANGPAAILLARTGHVERAVAMCHWMDANLIDPQTNLVIDGIKRQADGTFVRETGTFTYCQGVVLGAELEALRATGDQVHLDRLARLLDAVERHQSTDGVINSGGGGDGGLFPGILARYLALIATDLPAVAGGDELRARAGALVLASADSVWTHRSTVPVDGRASTLFGADWRRPARTPTDSGKTAQFVGGAVNASEIPERDLSVQLSGWTVLEAAVAVDLGLPEHPEK